MIDVHTFQMLLLTVCVLAFLGSVFALSIITSGSQMRRVLIKTFYAALGVASGVAGLVLLILK